jgi:signal transduction histidine kinase
MLSELHKIDEGGETGSALYAQQAEVILAQARRVMNITRQISEFSMPQSTEPELLDLNNLVRSTAKFISFDRRFSLIDMVLDLDPQLPAVRTVGDHVTQVIMNLLINAADATEGRVEPKPCIMIATRSNEGGVTITVTDNGAGMNLATLNRVFEEYFTTKPVGRGSGIGMTVSKSLIESGGGSISVESEPGSGTTVTVWLPVDYSDTMNV